VCIKGHVLCGHLVVKTDIVGKSAIRTAHGAGPPWSVATAIGYIALRIQIADQTRFETLLVLYVIRVVAVVAAEIGWGIPSSGYG
jgi:hypothetical protein